jgi:large subunit ribosomal protein L23
MDLRDYLYNIYGLRAFNITTQLLHGAYTRDGNAIGRYRLGQIKKMTIDMTEPFVWPEEPKDKDPWNVNFMKNLKTYSDEQQRFGSDKFKPGTAFNGVLGPYKPRPEPFIPKHLKKQLSNEKNKILSKQSHVDDQEIIIKHLES